MRYSPCPLEIFNLVEEENEHTITLAQAKTGRSTRCYGSMEREEGQGSFSVGKDKGEGPEQHCLVKLSARTEMF